MSVQYLFQDSTLLTLLHVHHTEDSHIVHNCQISLSKNSGSSHYTDTTKLILQL